MVAPASVVRSTGQLPGELHPVHHWPAGDENNFEADYLYELESKNTITSDMNHERTGRLRCELHGRVSKLVESWLSG